MEDQVCTYRKNCLNAQISDAVTKKNTKSMTFETL